MQTFEIGHLGGIACLDQCLETGLHQCRQSTAQYGLLTEQVGFRLLAKRCGDDTRPARANGTGISQGYLLSHAGGVLGRGDQGRHA